MSVICSRTLMLSAGLGEPFVRSTSLTSFAESLLPICPPVQSTHWIFTVSLFLIVPQAGMSVYRCQSCYNWHCVRPVHTWVPSVLTAGQ